MSIYLFLLAVHITAGIICLLTGLLAAFARKRRGVHTKAGEWYHFSYVIVFVTAVALSIMKWSELAFLFFVALFSYGLALYGYLARKQRWKNWVPKHINGMLGSYIGVITAILVVNGDVIFSITGIPPFLWWFLPTIIGSPLIAVTIWHYTTRRKVS